MYATFDCTDFGAGLRLRSHGDSMANLTISDGKGSEVDIDINPALLADFACELQRFIRDKYPEHLLAATT